MTRITLVSPGDDFEATNEVVQFAKEQGFYQQPVSDDIIEDNLAYIVDVDRRNLRNAELVKLSDLKSLTAAEVWRRTHSRRYTEKKNSSTGLFIRVCHMMTELDLRFADLNPATFTLKSQHPSRVILLRENEIIDMRLLRRLTDDDLKQLRGSGSLMAWRDERRRK